MSDAPLNPSRRRLLGGLVAAATIAPLSRARARARTGNPDVIVVGAGVFGAWCAWHLRKQGLRVLLLDQYGAASTRASSGGESRVIRMSYGPNELYTRSSLDSLAQWKRLFARIDRPELFRETGMLWLAPDGDELARQSREVLTRVGVRHEVLAHGQLARRYPQIAMIDGGWAVYEPDSGVLLARRAVQAVVADAVRAGVELRVERVLPVAGSARIDALRTASGATISAGRYVFACGPWLGKVLPDVLETRIFPTRQEVYYFGVPAGESRWAPPAFPVWLDFSREWYGVPDLESRGFKLALDTHGDPIDPDAAERTPTPALIANAREFLARRFPGLRDAPLVGAEVCQYENTSNGDFVLDRHPSLDNAWIAGGGSGHGFKHGPAIGAYVARRLLRGGDAEPRYGYAGKQEVQRREVL